MTDRDGYLTSAEVRLRFGITDMTLWRWLRDPALGFPAPIVIRGRRYFSQAEVQRWECQRDRPPASFPVILCEPFQEYHDLIAALRDRRQRLGLSNMQLEMRSGLQNGYVTKLENYGQPYGRKLGAVSLPLMLGGLNCSLVLVEQG